MRKSYTPAVDGLEHRVVLTSLSSFFHNATSNLTDLVSNKSTSLNGTLSGRYTVEKGPDAGASNTYTLSNLKGNIGKLGNSKGAGTVYSLGGVDKGQAPGVLNLTSSKGSAILTLKGPVQTGVSPLPKTFKYIISGGSGVAANLNGTGNATLKLTPKGIATITLSADSKHF
jgi:hypothetical protein